MPKFKIMQDVGPMGVFRLAEWEAESDKDALDGFLKNNPAYAGNKKGLIFAKPLSNGNGWSDDDVNEMAQKMYHKKFDDLDIDEQNKVYKAIEDYLAKENSPYVTPDERRNAGKAKYGSEMHNASDQKGRHLNIGDIVVIVGGNINEEHEVNQAAGQIVTLEDGTRIDGEELVFVSHEERRNEGRAKYGSEKRNLRSPGSESNAAAVLDEFMGYCEAMNNPTPSVGDLADWLRRAYPNLKSGGTDAVIQAFRRAMP